MKRFCIIFLIALFSKVSYAQSEFGVAADIGYSFKFINKPINQLQLGAIAAYSSGNRGYSEYAKQYLFGVSGIYGSYNGKSKWIPALNVGYGGVGLLYKLQVTPYYSTPSVNFNFFNILQTGIGYSVGYRKINHVNMNGVVFSISIAIGAPSYYINIST